jgi:hypothetical protein
MSKKTPYEVNKTVRHAHLDLLDGIGMQSFPASDPPPWRVTHEGLPSRPPERSSGPKKISTAF